MVDVIIPVYNEEKILREKAAYFNSLKNKARLIFVDGGSQDLTIEIAQNYGELIRSQQGRCHQMNAGAALADSTCLLFLHVDTSIEPEALEQIQSALQKGNCAGCLTLAIDDKHFIFRIFEGWVNWRARAFGVLDGDLGLFVNRDIFKTVGGFDPTPIMEDILFSRKIRKIARPHVLTEKIKASSRRWRDQGFLRTGMRYALAYLQLWTRIPFLKF